MCDISENSGSLAFTATPNKHIFKLLNRHRRIGHLIMLKLNRAGGERHPGGNGSRRAVQAFDHFGEIGAVSNDRAEQPLSA